MYNNNFFGDEFRRRLKYPITYLAIDIATIIRPFMQGIFLILFILYLTDKISISLFWVFLPLWYALPILFLIFLCEYLYNKYKKKK